jgi:hypothetical protein
MTKSIPQRLYDDEINFAVSTFWDAGFEVKLGDDMNGFKDETTVRTWAEAEAWLDAKAREHYPSSVYAMGVEAYYEANRQHIPDFEAWARWHR